MNFIDSKNPLGLPVGSVRAIMVLAFTAAVVIPLMKFSYMQQDIPQTVKEVILFMAGSLYPIIQQYFKARSEETARISEQKIDEKQAGLAPQK